MASRFKSSLVNSPFDDPALFVQFANEKRSLLFDLGDISALSIREILSISHVFITHTHIDHFFGFDRMLRLLLGRDKKISIYGPCGLFKNIEGKLASYNWNLVNNYEQNLTIHTTEICRDYNITRTYQCKNKFKPSLKKYHFSKNNTIMSEKTFKVKAIILDHGTPCIGFSLEEQPQVKIIPNKLETMNLLPGKWLKKLKTHIYNKSSPETLIKAQNNKLENVKYNLKALNKIVNISSGQKITYITDVSYTKNNKKDIIQLAYKSSQLFIEAVFSEKHLNIAIAKNHLTAKQAGQIARISKSKKYTLFHHSYRYIKNPTYLKKEANKAFTKLIKN